MKDPGVKGMFRGLYAGKRVLVTGHTGFKGSWLCEWLLGLGAEVTGYSLPPPTQPALFEQLGLAGRLRHIIGDIRDLPGLSRALREARPDFVFHLAAQPLVRDSYANPVETFAVNLMGTVHVLEALRSVRHPCAAVFITTDKCYENREWAYGYREEDPLGGQRPLQREQGHRRTGHQLLSPLIFRVASGEDRQRAGGQCHWRRGLGRGPDCAGLHAGAGEGATDPGAQSEGDPAVAACAGAVERVFVAGSVFGRRAGERRQKTEDRSQKLEVRGPKASEPLSTIHHPLSTPLDICFQLRAGA